MPASPAIKKDGVNNLVLNDLQFSNPLPSGKCIELRACNNVKSGGCIATNFAKRFVDLRQLTGAEIVNFIADAMYDDTDNFCIGISIGASGVIADACHDVYVHDGTIKNVRYGGTSAYKNGDGIAVEKGCTGLRFEKLRIEDVQDGGIDAKSPFSMKHCIIKKASRAIRVWEGLADLEDILIDECGEDIWLGGPNAKVRLNNVRNPARKLKIMSDAGVVPDNDPRLEWVTPTPPVDYVTRAEFTALEQRVEGLELKLIGINNWEIVKK